MTFHGSPALAHDAPHRRVDLEDRISPPLPSASQRRKPALEHRLQPPYTARLAACIVAATCLCLTYNATASPFDVYGFGSRATAMGGAMGAASRDHQAIFYNPANLTLREKTHFGFGLTLIEPRLSIESGGLYADDEVTLPDTNVGFTLGFNFPLGGLLDYRLAIGFALSIPLIELTRLEAIDPARPHFYIYQSLPDHLVLAPAIGVRITDWLRVGAGLQILAALSAELDVTADLVRRRIEERSLTVGLAGEIGPIVGVSAQFGMFEVGVTYREEFSLNYEIPVQLLIEGIGPLPLSISGTTLYNPRHVNLGVALHLEEPRLTLAADLTLALWSSAPDPGAQITAVLTDDELRPGAEPNILLEFRTPEFDLGAQDVWTPRLGAEYFVDDVWAVRGGYFFRPAVVPDQNGYSNVLDSNANVFSIGGGATFADPLQVAEEPMSIDLHVQMTHVSERDTVKSIELGSQVDGQYTAGGLIWNLGLEVRQDF